MNVFRPVGDVQNNRITHALEHAYGKDSNGPGRPRHPHDRLHQQFGFRALFGRRKHCFLKISRELLEAECDSRGRVPRIVKLLDNSPNSRAVFLVIAGAFVHDRRPTITPNRIFVIAGLIGKGSDSSASGKIKSDCFLPHRCIQKLRSFSTNEILWNLHSHFMFTGISINPSFELRSKIQFEVENWSFIDVEPSS
jgi:hypothetical protein